MDQHKLEFFKLDEIDRKVLCWLMDTNPSSIKSWIEYIKEDYARRLNVKIDGKKLYEEAMEK
jgi:hypothetical protein